MKPLPCPVCGSDAKIARVRQVGGGGYAYAGPDHVSRASSCVECTGCTARGIVKRSEAHAVEVWNRVAGALDRVEELEGALSALCRQVSDAEVRLMRGEHRPCAVAGSLASAVMLARNKLGEE